ncbi:retrovirus-related pol polyprotein from transposon TNT 1-94 [Tanacetum coccineum]|uniref:Retrovirus-related pol polyprotein from transposon TNT 1-94 n=1 Tax=Tanacetum coccineum TaxID=301880 RepID=A0ABQ4XYR3_9ASTR
MLQCKPGERCSTDEEHHSYSLRRTDAFDSDVDEGPITQTMFMTNLTSEDLIYDEAGTSYDSNTPSEYMEDNEDHVVQRDVSSLPKRCIDAIHDEMHEHGHFVGVQTALFKEVKEMEEIFDQMNNEVDKNTVDKQCAEIEKKNLLIENENLIVNCLSTQLLCDVEKSRCLDLEADMSKVHDESKLISKLERECLNLQLKYQHLQESFDNNKSHTVQETPDFNSFFKIKNLEHQIQEKDNVIRNLKVIVANVNDRSCEPYNAKDVTALIEQNDCVRIELEKVKQHYKELYDSIKITRAHTSEKTSTMLNEIESLKAQLRSKESCFTSDYVKPKVLAPGMKKQVTFSDKPGTSSSNTQKHEVHQKVQQTNIPVIPSTGVNESTEASGSKPRSNTKKNRILPAKKENKKEVEVQPRTNNFKSKSWLWHRRLNHLNFGTINDLARKDLVRGLPRLKFEKDHLCSACQLGKSKKFSHRPKSENTNMEVLHTLHMDLCGPMRVQSIKGKKYILVIRGY